MQISMETIYTDGHIIETHSRYIRYQSPKHPHKYDGNKWRYLKMPDVLTFKNDMVLQRQQHAHTASQHLNFEFPPDTDLSTDMLRLLREEGFELGCVEMYAIEGAELARLSDEHITLKQVTVADTNDYLLIFSELSEPYGATYIEEACAYIRHQIKHQEGQMSYYVAYDDNVPVGILNLIHGEKTLELDGFAVKPAYQHKGIGRRIQAQVGKCAGNRTVILVADAEDTVKEMYLKQGYTYLHYRYSALLA